MRDEIDIQVGKTIREFRRQRGLTQTQLGESIGVSFQQVQKYENGTNRVVASRLWRMSKVLDKKIHMFFKDID